MSDQQRPQAKSSKKRGGKKKKSANAAGYAGLMSPEQQAQLRRAEAERKAKKATAAAAGDADKPPLVRFQGKLNFGNFPKYAELTTMRSSLLPALQSLEHHHPVAFASDEVQGFLETIDAQNRIDAERVKKAGVATEKTTPRHQARPDADEDHVRNGAARDSQYERESSYQALKEHIKNVCDAHSDAAMAIGLKKASY